MSRLVLWNIDLTLIDVARVTRAAYAEAFEKVTGQPLVYLAAIDGLTDSQVFFEFLARNDVDVDPDDNPLPDFFAALGEAFARHRAELPAKGRLMAGAHEALTAVEGMADTVQTVVTGSIKPNAVAKLSAFGLDRYLDMSVGGFGAEHYPKASLLQFTRMRAEEAHQRQFPEATTVYVTASVRDVEAARIARVQPVGVVSGSATAAQLHAAGAEQVLDDLSETAAVLAALEAATQQRSESA
ncbi:HAD family hydrolase [Salinactinospora qingdaonensis]|uniref:Phosphoglycolate phosphatase, HAD superfamily n=1 Tax=Salinactinospora qingdaonensis TaxID=702744 RepID=A0ABP7FGN3_9ACTN